MNVVRNYDLNTFSLFDREEKVLETCHVGAEFIVNIYTNKPIYLTSSDDKTLYDNINSLFENKYDFDERGISKQTHDSIVWLSDETCSFDDICSLYSVQKINRLLLKRRDKVIEIRVINPFLEENCIKKNRYSVAFSSCNNGYYSKNLGTGTTFQNDFIMACNNVLKSKKAKILVKNFYYGKGSV